MKCKLSDICICPKGKIEVANLDEATYISTENMLPNRGGVVPASGLPTIESTQAFVEGDVLVSNIRPYFKKIWQATFSGGCSNDVLVFRAKNGIDKDFLYYVLSDDQYFNYATATSKGTKMPRGDKVAIMQYIVPNVSHEEQCKIASILRAIDQKIQLNKEINHNLQQQAEALYKKTFPYSVRDELPDNWHIGTVRDIIDLHDSKRIPLSSRERDKMTMKIYPYYGATSVMDHVEAYIFDGCYLLLGEDGTVIDDYGHPILQYVWGKFWVNNHAHIISGKNGFMVESLYLFFKQLNVRSIVTGAVQPKISQANLCSVPVVIPPEEVIRAFNEQIMPFFTMIRTNTDENARLSSLRDSLLPRIMAGEIDVSDIDI